MQVCCVYTIPTTVEKISDSDLKFHIRKASTIVIHLYKTYAYGLARLVINAVGVAIPELCVLCEERISSMKSSSIMLDKTGMKLDNKKLVYKKVRFPTHEEFKIEIELLKSLMSVLELKRTKIFTTKLELHYQMHKGKSLEAQASGMDPLLLYETIKQFFDMCKSNGIFFQKLKPEQFII